MRARRGGTSRRRSGEHHGEVHFGEGQPRERGAPTAVGDVVACEQEALVHQILGRTEAAAEELAVCIRRGVAELRVHMRERGSAEAAPSTWREVEQVEQRVCAL